MTLPDIIIGCMATVNVDMSPSITIVVMFGHIRGIQICKSSRGALTPSSLPLSRISIGIRAIALENRMMLYPMPDQIIKIQIDICMLSVVFRNPGSGILNICNSMIRLPC